MMARGQGQQTGTVSSDHILYGRTEAREQGEQEQPQLPRLEDAARALIADALELNLESRSLDTERDKEIEEILASACERLRDGQDLTDEQVGPVADVIEMDLDDREHDQYRDQDAEQTLTDALNTLAFLHSCLDDSYYRL